MMEIQSDAELCFPQLLNRSCKKPILDWSKELFRIALPSVSFITIVLNLLVIVSVSHFRQLHTPSNSLLLSLAVSDFLVGLLLMPLEVLRKPACWVLGDIACSLYFYLLCNIVISSIGTIVLISIDRYMAICDPLHYPSRVTVPRVRFCVFLCWIYCASYSGFAVSRDLTEPGLYNSCKGECETYISYIVGTIDVVLTFIIPVTVIILLYMRVFMVALSQARAMRSHVTAVTHQHSVKKTKAKSELKSARTLGLLVITYLICFCPYYSAFFTTVSSSTKNFVIFLFYFNSLLNPLIYTVFYPWFRKAIKLIFSLQILQPGSCEANIL